MNPPESGLVAVTGAAGFIGSHLCERLLEAGYRVTGIDAFTRFYARETKERNLGSFGHAPGFELRERNLLAGGLAAELAGARAVCHIAGRPGVRGGAAALFHAGNVATTEAVLHAAAAAGVPRVVLASSSSVYGASSGPAREQSPLCPLSAYGRSKRRAELVAGRLAGELGLELVTLRYFTVYGPRQRPDMAFARFIDAALSGGELPLLGGGDQVRDFTYVGDAVAATLAAMERGRPGGVYNVSGGRPAPLRHALGLLARELGASPRLPSVPADARDPRGTAADLTRARSELGYEPRVPLEQGLARQATRALALAA